MKAKLVAVVVPLGPAVTVLKVDVSRVIRIGLRVIDSNCRGLAPGIFSELGVGDC